MKVTQEGLAITGLIMFFFFGAYMTLATVNIQLRTEDLVLRTCRR